MATDEKGQEAIVIHWRLEEWFPDLGKEVLQKFKMFQEHLLVHNKTLNLIPSKTISGADQFHFGDSILATRIITKVEPQLSTIYDFGSGNGFPGIVFAVLNPKIKVFLVEADLKKVEFLKGVLDLLKVTNAEIINKNVESLPENSVQVAMCRGFANITKAILLTRKIFPKGGRFYHLKGEEWGLEVSEIPTQLCSVWTPALTSDYKLPASSAKFSVVLTEKIA